MKTITLLCFAVSYDAKAKELELPPRSSEATPGRDLLYKSEKLSPAYRERLIYNEIAKGNIPSHLRNLVPVHYKAKKNGKTYNVTIWVMKDYFSLGSDENFVRIPMNLYTAAALANRLDMTLPTRKMVNQIYNYSEQKLKPRPMPPTKQMTTSFYYMKHNGLIEDQIFSKGFNRHDLLVGHKKDVVLSPKLQVKNFSIAIYGWHKSKNRPIQPLSTVHRAEYADYSHGIRLISRSVTINGEPHDLHELLKDPRKAWMVSDEGTIYSVTDIIDTHARKATGFSSDT